MLLDFPLGGKVSLLCCGDESGCKHEIFLIVGSTPTYFTLFFIIFIFLIFRHLVQAGCFFKKKFVKNLEISNIFRILVL